MSQRESFIFFCGWDFEGEAWPFADKGGSGLLMPREALAGGPTGTMREPNSTPMVTSWVFEKRPSQRRIVRDDLPVPLSPMQTSFAI